MLKWAIVGAGGIADRRMIPAIKKDKNSVLAAVMDRNPTTAKAIGEKYGVPSFTDLDEMLEKVECDAVYIGTPVALHYSQGMTALKHKKHVFIEKPIAMNAQDGEKLVAAFKAANKQLTIGYMMKHHNLHIKAKEIIKSGGIGQVNDVRVQFSCWYPDIEGAWRQKKSLGGGGVVMDLGVHCIELVEFLLDEEIVEVKSFYSTRSFSYEVEDSAVIIFKTLSGVLGHIDVNFNVPDNASEPKLELYGTKGYVICRSTLGQIEDGTLSYLHSPQGDYSALQNRTVDKPVDYSGGNGDLYLKQLTSFRELIEGGKTDYFYADRAVQVQKIVDKIYNR